jgi:hypothetical protein
MYTCDSQETDDIWKLVAKILHQEPLLHNVKHHQQRLDRFGIETIFAWFQDLCCRNKQNIVADTCRDGGSGDDNGVGDGDLILSQEHVDWARVLDDYMARENENIGNYNLKKNYCFLNN